VKRLAIFTALLPLAGCVVPTTNLGVSGEGDVLPVKISLPPAVVPAPQALLEPAPFELPAPHQYRPAAREPAGPKPSVVRPLQPAPVAAAPLGPSIDY
jgi:hypothetical protein